MDDNLLLCTAEEIIPLEWDECTASQKNERNISQIKYCNGDQKKTNSHRFWTIRWMKSVTRALREKINALSTLLASRLPYAKHFIHTFPRCSASAADSANRNFTHMSHWLSNYKARELPWWDTFLSCCFHFLTLLHISLIWKSQTCG